ncbi:MAG: rod shape-determining protein MreD [Microthrixaceae bacterium]|nr:rod shape-determining protein MreD [Microthrixaceae bacterium]
MIPARLGAVVFTALVLQVSLFSRFSFDGARPDVMILVAVVGGFVCGADRGAVIGFTAGLAYDLVLSTPLGLSAFVYTLVGYTVGAVASSVVRSAPWIGPVVVALGSAAGMVLYALVAEVLGQAAFSGPPLTAIVVVVAAVNTVLAPIVVRAMRWARQDEADARHPYFLR